MSAELQRSWLIQRLSKPHQGGGLLGALGDNPFSFGGGLRNGGLSDDAMNLIRPIISFEYMGSAEFEWGAVPEAFSKIAQPGESLRAVTFEISLANVMQHWSDRSKTQPEGTVTIYVLGQDDHLATITDRIEGWAAGVSGDEYRTKERVGLSDVLRPGNYAPDTCGWLELDNGFMFFTDRGMWEATCALFGVSTPAVTS